jgi:Na+/H+ antiporter NhaD/arsenite permease-like protein
VSIGSNHKSFSGTLKKYKMKVDPPLVSFSGEGIEDSIIHKNKKNSETQFRAVSRKYPWQILKFSDGLLVVTSITFTNVGTVTTADCEKF